MKLIYLASPYSHPDFHVRAQRFHAVCKKVVEMMETGDAVFSPIINGHPLTTGWGVPYDYEQWKNINAKMISVSDEFHVLRLPEWRDSLGVQDELGVALRLGKRIVHHEP